LTYSILVANINALRIRTGDDRLPCVCETALAYSPMEQISVGVGVRKDPSFPLEVAFAAECEPLRGCSLRVGSSPVRETFSVGGGFSMDGVHCDYGFSLHLVLGGTHMLAIAIII
jgi:hypothetical protein